MKSWLQISADEMKRLEYEAREKAIRDHNHLMKANLEMGMNQIQKEQSRGILL